MEDSLILGLFLSIALIHIELPKWKILTSPHNITTEKNVDCPKMKTKMTAELNFR